MMGKSEKLGETISLRHLIFLPPITTRIPFGHASRVPPPACDSRIQIEKTKDESDVSERESVIRSTSGCHFLSFL